MSIKDWFGLAALTMIFGGIIWLIVVMIRDIIRKHRRKIPNQIKIYQSPLRLTSPMELIARGVKPVSPVAVALVGVGSLLLLGVTIKPNSLVWYIVVIASALFAMVSTYSRLKFGVAQGVRCQVSIIPGVVVAHESGAALPDDQLIVAEIQRTFEQLDGQVVRHDPVTGSIVGRTLGLRWEQQELALTMKPVEQGTYEIVITSGLSNPKNGLTPQRFIETLVRSS